MSNMELFQDAGDKIFAQSGSQGSLDQTTWSAIEQVEFDRLLLAESQGGAGDAFQEAAALCRSLGQKGAQIPLVETLVANWCLSKAELHVEVGPKGFIVADSASIDVAGGTITFSSPIQIPWGLPNGQVVMLLPNGDDAMLCHAVIGAECSTSRSLAGYPIASIPADVTLRGKQLVPFSNHARALSLAAILKAAAMSGAMDTTLLLSTEYANTRQQFGRAIGSFQAVQHMVVKIASETAAVGIAVEHAVSTLSTNPLWGAALAKGRASEAAGYVSAAAHQLHGAIGYTHEYALQQFTRNLLAWREEYGNEYAWYNRIGSARVSCDEPLWARMSASGLL